MSGSDEFQCVVSERKNKKRAKWYARRHEKRRRYIAEREVPPMEGGDCWTNGLLASRTILAEERMRCYRLIDTEVVVKENLWSKNKTILSLRARVNELSTQIDEIDDELHYLN